MKNKKHATVEELISTYASHVSESYPSPAQFRGHLDRILAEKRSRLGGDEYIAALETNIVFLRDLVVEGEALLDIMFGAKRAGGMDSRRINALLGEMEERVRGSSARRREEAFSGDADEEFAELRGLRASGGPAYVEKLEFNYRYLMAFKILLFEFFNVAGTVLPRYAISGATEEGRRLVLRHVELTVNYYIGNISVRGEGEG